MTKTQPTGTATDVDAVKTWLTVLHGDSPGLIHICATGLWTGEAFDNIDAAAAYATRLDASGREGVYARATTLRAPLPPHTRGGEADTLALPGLWADIDIAGPGHKTNQPLPPSEAEGRRIIDESGLPAPTVWVHSGGGLYPWWLLDAPHTVDGDLEDLKEFSARWQAAIAASAARLGWHYGTEVGDLARVLRIPGTTNRKVKGDPRPCRIIDGSAMRYSLDGLRADLAATMAANPPPKSEPEAPREPPKSGPAASGGVSPGDDYESRTDWADILGPAGWCLVFSRGNTRHWRRPGKDGRDTSATTGHSGDRDRLFVFTTSTEFQAWAPYTKFGAYAVLNHGGDYKAAARELRRLGYGTPTDRATTSSGTSSDDLYDLAGEGRPSAGTARAAAPPRIDITFEPVAIRGVGAALRAGHIPDVYVRQGALVHVADHGGGSDDHLGPTIGVVHVTADGLRRLLASHAFTYREKTTKEGDTVEVPAVPAVATCRAVLTETAWPGMRPLRAVVASPVLRPDGTLLQTPGYDADTALYYCPDLDIPHIPDQLDADQITAARAFVLDHLLIDFPWASDADLANYVALLVTPILQPYVRGLTPLGAVSATERGSGKTLLTTVMGMLYGSVSRPWTSDDEELRKAITSTLDSHAPVVIFDNVGERDEVASPVLAKLLTSKAWNDRLLGSNTQAQQTNDRVWLVTGNNIAFGGDIAQRAVLVRLDPKMPRPDLRTGFRIADLEDWLEDDTNRAALLHALLILVRSWIASGGRQEEFAMRGFRRWACALGGFIAHHGIRGFLANAHELEQHDEEEQRWYGFLKGWYDKFGAARRTAQDLLNSVETVPGFGFADPWSGAFITRANGSLPSVVGLGKMLSHKRGRTIGGLTLHGEYDKHAGTWSWWVEPYQPEERESAGEGAQAA